MIYLWCDSRHLKIHNRLSAVFLRLKVYMEEYKNLCAGVLTQAIMDLKTKKNPQTRTTPLKNLKAAKIRKSDQAKISRDAFTWFQSKEQFAFSFENVCLVLNLDAQRVKNKIFKQVFPTLINL